MRLSQLKFEALGTHWFIKSDCGQAALEQSRSIAIEFESSYSRFNYSTSIGKLNKGLAIEVRAELIDILDVASQLHQASQGLFDIRVASDLSRMGYGPELKAKKTKAAYGDCFKHEKNTLKLNGCAIDLGGCAKGYLIDKIANYLKKAGAKEIIINGGGDIFIDSETAQSIDLINPFNQKESIGRVTGYRLRFASSSPMLRMWSNKENHHIIDPASGESSSKWRQSYVIAPSVAIADGLATTSLLTNDSALLEQLFSHFKAEVVLVSPSGSISGKYGKAWDLN